MSVFFEDFCAILLYFFYACTHLAHCRVNKWHFVFVLKQVVLILVSANISAIQVSALPILNHQSKFRKFTWQGTSQHNAELLRYILGLVSSSRAWYLVALNMPCQKTPYKISLVIGGCGRQMGRNVWASYIYCLLPIICQFMLRIISVFVKIAVILSLQNAKYHNKNSLAYWL